MELLKKHVLSLLIVLFAMIGFVPTSYASNEIYLESGDTYSNTLQSSDDVHWYRIDTKQDNSDIAIYLTNTTAPPYSCRRNSRLTDLLLTQSHFLPLAGKNGSRTHHPWRLHRMEITHFTRTEQKSLIL